MARTKTKANSTEELATTVTDTTTAATARVLSLAAEAGRGPDKAANATALAELARICEEAAGHMATAHRLLFDGPEGGEAALGHLDAALKCLKQLEAEGARRADERERKAV